MVEIVTITREVYVNDSTLGKMVPTVIEEIDIKETLKNFEYAIDSAHRRIDYLEERVNQD